MNKEITFDLEKFLNEDCKEENEIGVQMTFSILRKAFDKGLQNSAFYCYEKGMKNAKIAFIAVLTELQLRIEEKFSNCDICEYYEDYDFEENDISEYRSVGSVSDITDLIQQKINALRGEDK